MTEAMMADFVARADALSFEETISVIAMLAEKMRRQFAIVNNSHDTPAFVDEMFAIADSDPELHKSETKWTRDELHRY